MMFEIGEEYILDQEKLGRFEKTEELKALRIIWQQILISSRK